jgi:thiol-disulfide isomerase/thioredoxin
VALRLAAAAFAVAASAAMAETQLRPWAGAETPALARQDLSGKMVDLKDFKGRVVLINFWATWCVPCREEMPSLERLRTKLNGRPFEVLTVNYGEGPARIKSFLEKEKISLPVLLDPEKLAAADWRAGGLPMTFLVDAEGRVRYSAFGECDWSEGEPFRVVENLVAEAPRARR